MNWLSMSLKCLPKPTPGNALIILQPQALRCKLLLKRNRILSYRNKVPFNLKYMASGCTSVCDNNSWPMLKIKTKLNLVQMPNYCNSQFSMYSLSYSD